MRDGFWRRLVALAASLMFIALMPFASMPLAAAEPTVTIEPYTKDEFPGWLQDLRRAEIVSLGSLPFVTLGVTLGYSLYRYFSHGMDSNYFPNPFAKSSSAASLTTDEQLGIFFTSLGVAAAVGITDFTISSIQRHQRKKAEIQRNSEGIEIIPLGDGVEALPLEEVDLQESPSSQQDMVEGQEPQDIPLVQSQYREFPPFGLFLTMPQVNGVLPHA